MSKAADHDLRRRQIADAVCVLIAEHGLDAVTVARTAATAGISVGLVQHYFRTKDEMLSHAYHQVTAAIRQRADEHIRAGIAHRQPISRVLAAALAEFVPLDPRRRTEARVSRAFAGRALDVPALAELDLTTSRQLRHDIAQAVQNGKECGEVGDDTDPWTAAVRLAAVTEGLTMQFYRDPDGVGGDTAAALASSVLEAELATVFTGACRQYADPLPRRDGEAAQQHGSASVR